MAVGSDTFPALMNPVPGFRLGTASAGIKTPGRRDLVVMALAEGSTVAGVFTRNAFCAAPVQVAKDHLRKGAVRYLVTNTGNANAGTGRAGVAATQAVCAEIARLGGVAAHEVLPFSTGVIGQPLAVDKIVAALPAACADLCEDGWRNAALGILTTDTRPKGATRQLVIAGRTVTLSGIAKGSGMIKPDMATMLAYVATDARVSAPLLQQMLANANRRSFNRITVDGDTSTNDALMLIATGCSGAVVGPDDAGPLQAAIDDICLELAHAVVRDGEGATKFVTVAVAGGATAAECLRVGYAVAESPLVKTALFAADPNWGRILAAIGRAGIESLDVERVRVWLDDVLIAEDGGCATSYTEAAGQAVMDRDEFTIRIDLGRGDCTETLWTCDLSHDYVRINAEYRS